VTPRVAFFGSGSPASVVALSALAGPAAVVVLPDGRSGLRALRRSWRRRRAAGPLRDAAERLRLPILWYRPDRPEHLADELGRLAVDLACVATFPYVLPEPVLRAARDGAIGTHPSLLPRHRGPDPIFWTYHADDADTGVSIFRLDRDADTGDVLAQDRVPLARGRLGSDLYLELAERGAALLARTVAQWSGACALPQDDRQATHEPAPREGRWRIDFDAWGAERVWHFLRGVGERGGLLRDAGGRALGHGPALGFTLGPPRGQPGAVEPHSSGLAVQCRDGVVEVAGR
jgi:methionyl-tRNA formyltransferase